MHRRINIWGSNILKYFGIAKNHIIIFPHVHGILDPSGQMWLEFVPIKKCSHHYTLTYKPHVTTLYISSSNTVSPSEISLNEVLF